MMTLLEELSWRGFVNQTTYKDTAVLNTPGINFYWGVDPSADSMTIGNLAAAMMARHFIAHGHNAYLLVGGATGMIGDPDGKSQERDLLTLEQLEANKRAISAQYAQVFAGSTFTVVDNYDWFKDMGYLQFLREIGKHVPMRQMLAREFVQSRLSEDGAGISYAEFSYSLIQGYDFLHLFREHDVNLQLAGADQWGNCIAGVELIRRITGNEAHVWSSPLIINKATGKKFGKTEDGAIWLDERKTSVFKFYQFWINADDEGVEEYTKIYTLLDVDALDELMQAHKANPAARLAQRRLAFEVTRIVHGEQKARSVERITDILFARKSYDEMESNDIQLLKAELPCVDAATNTDLAGLLVQLALASSKTEARQFIQSGAISINGDPYKEPLLAQSVFKNRKTANIKRGKNNFGLITVE